MPGVKQRLWKTGVQEAKAKAKAKATPAPKPGAKRGRKRSTMEAEKMSPMALLLQKDWLKSRKSSSDIQEYAEASASSGGQGTEELAACGAEGYSFKNLARDVRRKLLPSSMKGPSLYWLDTEEGRLPMVLFLSQNEPKPGPKKL